MDNQKLAAVVSRIRMLRSDCTRALNPYTLRDVLDGTLEVLEFICSGQVTSPNPNQVPGQALNPLDQGQAVVHFFGGPQATTSPGTPVNNNGDVKFIPGPPPGSPGVVGGQTVQFYNGPQGSPHAVANPEAGGQRVEFYDGPPVTPINNPPSATLGTVGGASAQAVTVEAGHLIPTATAPQLPTHGLPHAPPFARTAEEAQPVRRPQTREELLAMLPLPGLATGSPTP